VAPVFVSKHFLTIADQQAKLKPSLPPSDPPGWRPGVPGLPSGGEGAAVPPSDAAGLPRTPVPRARPSARSARRTTTAPGAPDGVPGSGAGGATPAAHPGDDRPTATGRRWAKSTQRASSRSPGSDGGYGVYPTLPRRARRGNPWPIRPTTRRVRSAEPGRRG